MNSSDVKIYEPLYASGQQLVEGAFVPLTLERNIGAEWRELAILVHMYKRGLHREQRFTGLFSPKFRTKALITGADFLAHVEAHSDADVIFLNPMPHHPYMLFNAWRGGEISHPGLVYRTQELLAAVGVPWDLDLEPYHGPDVACYCNF